MFHFNLEEIMGFLVFVSLVSLAVHSSGLSNSILSSQVLEFLNRFMLPNSWVASI